MRPIRAPLLAAVSLAVISAGLAPAAPPAAPPPAAEKVVPPPAAPLYDEKADAKAQIAAALAKATKENRRVLVQWGGNWCGWCTKLHGLFKRDKEIARKLTYEYDVVYVDAGRPAGKNLDLATSYGADLKAHGFPFLTVLDADGKPLANQETGSLENADQKAAPGHDPAAILAFLTEHQAPSLDAQAVLDAGLAEAERSGKRVFLHFGAPWCGWCHRLEAWMDREDIKAVLDKQFVDVKIDTERTVGGQSMYERLSGGEGGGIPWFAFLDADGKPLADSNGPEGNVGFPYQPAEVAHFKVMLERAAPDLTPREVRTLTASLDAGREKDAARPR